MLAVIEIGVEKVRSIGILRLHIGWSGVKISVFRTQLVFLRRVRRADMLFASVYRTHPFFLGRVYRAVVATMERVPGVKPARADRLLLWGPGGTGSSSDIDLGESLEPCVVTQPIVEPLAGAVTF